MSTTERIALQQAQRIVVKIGSALLSDLQDGLATDKIAAYSRQIHELMAQGKEVVLVSSGAVAQGCAQLGWRQRPQTVHELHLD